MVVRSRILWLPKAEHGDAEYEDAWCTSEGMHLPFRAAVADGATESIFAGAWARRLVRGVVEEGAEALAENLSTWQADWAAAVAARRPELPWYAAAKAEEGAFATLLGLSLRREGTWQAVAVGDCCLFHLRAGEQVNEPWPVATPDAFDNRPALLPSRSHRPTPESQQCSGVFAPGDAFILATDAAAAWLMHAGPATVRRLGVLQFEAAVRDARRAGTLRDDDTTALVLEIVQP